MSLKKNIAFTLAETLIVMGVIGIVSALTLPNLNSSTGDKERVAKVKKIYQNLNDALGRAEAVYGPYEQWFINDADATAKAKRFGERMTEFMKVSKSCAQVSAQGCFTAGKSKNLSGNESLELDNGTVYYRVITADGTSVAFLNNSDIWIDIDGPSKGQYTRGKDLFEFAVTSDGLLEPNGHEESFSDLVTRNKSGGSGSTASAWIIRYDNADYLKIGSDGKCPNGTTPTESNPRCK